MAHGSDPVALKDVVNLAPFRRQHHWVNPPCAGTGRKAPELLKDIIAGRGNWRAWARLRVSVTIHCRSGRLENFSQPIEAVSQVNSLRSRNRHLKLFPRRIAVLAHGGGSAVD